VRYPSRGAAAPDTHLLAWRDLTAEQIAAWSGFVWAHAQVVRKLDAELKREHGIPLAWFDVLYQLSIATGQRLRLSELADKIVLDATGLTDLVERLESAGLVHRGRGEVALGEIYVRISDRALEILEQATQTHVDGIKKHFFEYLSDAQTEQLAMIWHALLGH
jgi:DNA-binding MarR family transcriptional regulator